VLWQISECACCWSAFLIKSKAGWRQPGAVDPVEKRDEGVSFLEGMRLLAEVQGKDFRPIQGKVPVQVPIDG
jgi:hypothetical protein